MPATTSIWRILPRSTRISPSCSPPPMPAPGRPATHARWRGPSWGGEGEGESRASAGGRGNRVYAARSARAAFTHHSLSLLPRQHRRGDWLHQLLHGILADATAHLCADHRGEAVVETRPDARVGNFLAERLEAGKAMRDAWRGGAGHRDLGD